MKTTLCLIAVILITGVANAQEKAPDILPVAKSKDLIIRDAKVSLLEDLDLLVFEIATQGKPGNTVPTPRGTMAGAPVLGYVFPTTLKASDVGFSETDGTVALAVTSHPDFDDTPLWDENNDRQFKNDGVVFHTHWVVLKQDTRVKGGLAVKQITDSEKKRIKLPPTNPGMPMYMDSPGLTVVIKDDTLRVLVPLWRVNHQKDFKFDAVAAYMQVMPSGDYPLLSVYEVYSVWSGNLSLPGRVQQVCRQTSYSLSSTYRQQ